MVTRYTVVQDGQVYEPGDDVPDMGSITALESKGKYREYNALSKDNGFCYLNCWNRLDRVNWDYLSAD